MIWILWHLGGMALMLAVCAGAGDLCLRRLRMATRLERAAFSLCAGAALWALLLFLLGLAGWLYRPLIVALTWLALAAIVAAQWRTLRRPAWRGAHLLVTIVVIAVEMLLLALALYPPDDSDALMYHLVLSRNYLAAHAVTPQLDVIAPVVPALNHMLFAWGMALHDDVLGQLWEHIFTVLTALLLYALGMRAGRPWMGAAAAAIWLGHPLVIWLNGSAYVDPGVACFTTAGLYALRVWRDETNEHGGRWWLLAMALLGAAAGVKIMAGPMLAAGACLGAWRAWRHGFPWRELVSGWALAALFIIPFYGFILWTTGNPLWPMLPSLSRGVWGGQSSAGFDALMTSIGVARTPLNFLSLPVLFVLHPETFYSDRAVLPLIALLPLAWLVAVWQRSVRWWVLWTMLFTVFLFWKSQQLRYWIVVAPIAGLAICESLAWALDRLRLRAHAQRLIWIAVTGFALFYGGRYAWADIAYKGVLPVSKTAQRIYLEKFLAGYKGVSYVNQRAAADDAVYIVNAFWLHYYLRPRSLDYGAFIQPPGRPPAINRDDAAWARYFDAQGIRWILINPRGMEFPAGAWRPCFENFQLVYEDDWTWVFQRAGSGDSLPCPAP
ncbi:MAG: hypothetical protein ACKV2V_01830 [Blastocatellia bacterium]